MSEPPTNEGGTKYRTIVADPPWRQKVLGRQLWREGSPSGVTRPLSYPLMDVAEISALPISDLADESAHLYLWTTQKYLRQSWDVVEAWGFHPSCVLAWCKEPRGFGMGGMFQATLEFVQFAWRGEAPPKNVVNRQWFEWPRGEHSAKPEAFLDLVEQASPGPYLELFARRQRLGWDTWGNEALEHVELSA